MHLTETFILLTTYEGSLLQFRESHTDFQDTCVLIASIFMKNWTIPYWIPIHMAKGKDKHLWVYSSKR